MWDSLQLQVDSKDQPVFSLKSHLDTYIGEKGTDFTTSSLQLITANKWCSTVHTVTTVVGTAWLRAA